ncbi:MAG: UMP kinase [Candidatus ainarchaeum sp.]|nr:UMP kinase [Candidatus ainarchaeum sp.]
MLPEFFNSALMESETSREPSRQAYSYDSNSSGIFVVSIGGSLLFEQGSPRADSIKRIASTISSLHSQGYKFALVVGGGALARDFIETARQLGSNNFELDEIGIFATRLNAMLFIEALENSFHEVLTDIKKSKAIIDSGKIPVFGGLISGVTTDFDAALIAEYLNASFVNLSNVEGIFNADPKTNPDAELHRELSHNGLLSILVKLESRPGQNLIIDIPAVTVLKRSKITAFFLNGSNMQNFESAIRGESFDGTIVSANPDVSETEIQEDSQEPEKKHGKRKSSGTAKKRKKPRNDDSDAIAMGLRLH